MWVNLPTSIASTVLYALGSSSTLLFLTIFYLYSLSRFQTDMEFMTGNKPGTLFKYSLLAPIILSLVRFITMYLPI